MLPTQEEFERLTSLKGDGHGRGSSLLRIDGALQNWQLRMNGSVEGQVEVLYLIIKECGHYLKKHSKKKFNFFGGHKPESRRQTRTHRVEELRKEAERELRRVAPTIGRAFDFVQLRKRRQLERLNPKQSPFQTKSLEGGFQHERREWLEGNKRVMPFSGTRIFNDLRPERDFNSLSPREYEQLGRGTGAIVTFHNKISRMQFLAMPDGNGGFTDIAERPIHMDGYDEEGEAKLHVYALDHRGNLLTRADIDFTKQHQEYFNHSSFNAGRDVMCAGSIWIRDGKLKHIDNWSGHYKPSWNDLVRALQFFCEEDIDLAETRVVDHSGTKLWIKKFRALGVLSGTLEPYSKEQEIANGLRGAPQPRLIDQPQGENESQQPDGDGPSPNGTVYKNEKLLNPPPQTGGPIYKNNVFPNQPPQTGGPIYKNNFLLNQPPQTGGPIYKNNFLLNPPPRTGGPIYKNNFLLNQPPQTGGPIYKNTILPRRKK